MTFKPRLPKIGKAKLPLFLLGILTLLTIIINLLPKKSAETKIRLTSSENKFQVSFEVAPGDLNSFDRALEKLNIDKAVKDKLEFELDATSSAKLSLASPIEAGLGFSNDEIRFRGNSHTAYLKQSPFFNIKIPKSTSLLIFSGILEEIWGKNLNNSAFKDWIGKNISVQGQYFIIFGNDSQKAFIFNLKNTDFESLKSLKDIEYKKEDSQEQVEYHLLKTLSESQDSQTYVLFQKDDKLYLTFSLDSAKSLNNVLTEDKESLDYPQSNQKEAAFSILFLNQSELSTNFFKSVFGEISQFQETLNRISRFELVLKGDTFSGLINIK